MFGDRTRELEGHVNQLLQLAGWTDKRFGCAAKGEFYIAKFGDIRGEYIGLWSKNKHDCEVAAWPTNLSAKAIVEAILAKTDGAPASDPTQHPLYVFMQ